MSQKHKFQSTLSVRRATITGCCITAKILEYFGIFAAIVGLYIVVTPQMILVNKYYLERKDKLNEY
ncbi:MAG: hypothetical protein ACLSGX_02865 [Pseudoruminococcus massiliensis]|uniref:hypothetical protein n=1 Tax=Pseudoruminococcus massiliensis TaxID=2086583 RepID=UPI0039920335|nr:hypothetical protein [Oscillospiraceae bacterium]